MSAVLDAGTLEITVADVFGGPRELELWVDVADVHGDGSNVPLGPSEFRDSQSRKTFGPAAVKPTAKSLVPDSLRQSRTKTCCPSTKKACRR